MRRFCGGGSGSRRGLTGTASFSCGVGASLRLAIGVIGASVRLRQLHFPALYAEVA
jgi:hypothetical protein